jgi:hypothetical protein
MVFASLTPEFADDVPFPERELLKNPTFVLQIEDST